MVFPVRTVQIEALPHRYQEDVASAVKTLQRFGAERVILYGSLARGDARADSDLDICVEGLPDENFFRVLGECLLHSEHSISVIDLQSSYGLLRNRILQDGLVLYERERV